MSDHALANVNEADIGSENQIEPENVPRLGPLSSQSSANQPHSNGVCVTHIIPIGAFPHEIYSGG